MALLHPTFIRRQLTSTRNQSAVFVLCVALAMVTLVAVRGFGDSVDRALTRDSRALIAGDVRVTSNYPFAPELDAAVQAVAAADQGAVARSYEFYSVVRKPTEDGSLLANLKAVDAAYPLYGQVTLASGRPLHAVLTPGTAVAEQALLDRLGIQVGATLAVGETMLRIVDVVTSEPDRPVNFFALGPRLLFAAADLPATQLVQPGSRITNRWMVRAATPADVDAIAAGLRSVADPDLVRIDTFRSADTGVERFYRNFLFFLALVGIFTLLLAGIGIQSSLTAFLRERYTTIAITKTVGATTRFVTANFYGVVLLLGGIGALLGMVLGFALQWLLPGLLGALLPPDVELIISTRAVLESLLLGLVVVLVFTFLPLFRLEELRPSFIFRKEEPPVTRWLPYVLTVAVILALFTGLVIWQLGQVMVGLYFTGGAVALLLVAALLAEGALRLVRRFKPKDLAVRQAQRGLFRPRNATRAIVITLATALGVLFCIYLIEQNLRASFVQSYPPDAPNVFFLDVQPDQVQGLGALLERQTGAPVEFIPTVRAALVAVNGQEPAPEQEEPGGPGGQGGQGNGQQGENEQRRNPQYTLTYRDTLQPDESIAAGPGLFDPALAEPQVSVLQETLDARRLKLGDRLTFRVQGVPVEATITSVRKRERESVAPFFSFVLQPAILQDAPQTLFTGLRVPPDQIAALQNAVVAQFTNISVIDATATIASFAAVVDRITRVVRFFALFSILAGLLIVVSSVYATRLARIQEAVYYKVLGATRRFVTKVFVLENILLGLVSGLLALLMAQIGAYLIMRYLFELEYQGFWPASLVMVVFTVAAVTLVGMGASIGILRSRPITFLRQQGEEE